MLHLATPARPADTNATPKTRVRVRMVFDSFFQQHTSLFFRFFQQRMTNNFFKKKPSHRRLQQRCQTGVRLQSLSEKKLWSPTAVDTWGVLI